MRLPRPKIFESCCIHVTHRCQERRYLLKTAVDRKQYRLRLFEATQMFPKVRILNYVITSNHVHLLVWVRAMHDLSAMMQWLQGTTAQDFNRRKSREGSFWRGRFHPTLVQSGHHLSRCLFYMDMNMVRAGVVPHPNEWPFGGAADLAGQRERYRIVDLTQLLDCLGMAGQESSFHAWHASTLAELCRQTNAPRQPFWSTAFAVGASPWLSNLGHGRVELEEYISPVESELGTDEKPEADALHTLQVPQSLALRLWRQLMG
jgi:putative transposase